MSRRHLAGVCLAALLGGVVACSSQGDIGGSSTLHAPAGPASATAFAPAPAGSSTPLQSETTLVARMPSLQAGGRRSPRLSTALGSQAWREVALLQMALNVVDRPGLTVDGHYGPPTLYSVIRFQQESGIRVTGVVGPATLRALAQALSAPGGAVPPGHR